MMRAGMVFSGVVLVALGLLWLMQGLDVVRVCPLLCFVDCKCVSGSSPLWAGIGAVAVAVGAVSVYLAVRWRPGRHG
ncbi:MAG TPA: hypothetical protein VMG41_09555 [Gemmatimonadales bacterium]|nr:hypothetical protein [Gemmatimonadales bacterium]